MEKTMQKSLEENLKKIYFLNFLKGLWFSMPVFVIYFLDNGINLTQLGMILGAYAIMPFFLDIPSSIWADKYSRKFVLVLSEISMLVGDVILLSFHSFEYFLLALCFVGVSIALSSGTFSALTYDTLLSLGREEQYEKIQSRVMRNYFLGTIIASLIGAYVYSINAKGVFLLAAIVDTLLVISIFSLKEPPREKSISKSFHQLKEGAGILLKNQTVWSLIIIFSMMMAASDVLFSYYQPILRAAKIPVIYLGVVYAVIGTLNFIGSGLYTRLGKKIGWKSLMLFYLSIVFVASVLFSSNLIPLIFVSIGIMSISFGSYFVYISGVVHNAVPSSHRATALSIQNMIYMLSFLTLVNVVSFVMDHSSISYGMLLNSAMALILMLSFLKIFYNRKNVIIEIS